MSRLHLPHPHIADRIAAWLAHEPPMPERKVPPAEDWDDWHYAPERGDWEGKR